jgi:hypothetical protein
MVFKHQSFHEHPPTVENEFPPAAALEGAVSDALAAAGGIDATGVHVIAEGSTINVDRISHVGTRSRSRRGDRPKRRWRQQCAQ